MPNLIEKIQVQKLVNYKRLETVRILIAQLATKDEEWNHPERLYFPRDVNHFIVWIKNVIAIAEEENVNLVVMPELSVPHEALTTLIEWSKDKQTVVVAGSHYKKSDNKYIACCPVIIHGDVFPVEKLQPYPLEYSAVSGWGIKEGNRLPVFIDSPIGNLAVMICSDYLDRQIRSTILDYNLDLIIVPACHNKSEDYHTRMDIDCRESESGLYLVYANVLWDNYGDGNSALFGIMDKDFLSDLTKAGYTDGQPKYKLCRLTSEQEYMVFDIDINPTKKRPTRPRIPGSKPNVNICAIGTFPSGIQPLRPPATIQHDKPIISTVAELTAKFGFHWRGRTKIPIHSLFVATNELRGIRPADVRLEVSNDSYRLPPIITKPIRDYVLARFLAKAHRQGQVVDNLPNYRVISEKEWFPKRHATNFGDDCELVFRGHVVYYYDVVVTNLSMDEPLKSDKPSNTIRDLLQTQISPYDALWATGCPLAINLMIITEETNHVIINVRGNRCAENWTQYGPSISGTIILDDECLVLSDDGVKRVDFAKAVEIMVMKELGGFIPIRNLVCICFAMGLNKGLPALLAYATTTASQKTIVESLQISNRWETTDVKFVSFEANALLRFYDGIEPADGIRRVPYLEICSAMALYHKFGSGAFR